MTVLAVCAVVLAFAVGVALGVLGMSLLGISRRECPTPEEW